MTIRALVVDDEPLARERILQLLKAEPEVKVIGKCSTGDKAIAEIESLKPDLVFLDVQMPEIDGFGVLEAISKEHLPVVIFVTAYDKYALQAFDANAVDYLLKPFDEARFHRAVKRAKEQIAQQNGGSVSKQLRALLQNVKADQRQVNRLVIKSGGRVIFLKADEIDYIEAAGNYLSLHVGKETHLLRETMNGLEAKVDPEKFLRIHRSTMVNLESIKELRPWVGGEYAVILRDGKQLTLSRTYREKVRQLLGR